MKNPCRGFTEVFLLCALGFILPRQWVIVLRCKSTEVFKGVKDPCLLLAYLTSLNSVKLLVVQSVKYWK